MGRGVSECSRCSTAAHECFVARLAGSLDRGGEGEEGEARRGGNRGRNTAESKDKWKVTRPKGKGEEEEKPTWQGKVAE